MALTLRDGLTVSLGDILTFLPLHSLALPLIDVIADLLGDLTTLLLGLLRALLGGDVTADLRVVNLLADLAGHGVADLGVDSVAFLLVAGRALLTGNVLKIELEIGPKMKEVHIYPALLLRHQRTLPLVDNATLLGGNILTNFILNSLALPLIDDLTLRLSPGGALLLHDRGTLLLVPCTALLVKLSGAFLLVDGLLDSPGQIDALHLGDAVALLSELLAALLLDVIGSLAILLVLKAALLARDSFLNRLLGDLALALLDISTDGVGDIMALPPGDGVINSFGNLLADLLGDLAAHWLRRLPDHGRGVTLERDLNQGEKKTGDDETLHVEALKNTDIHQDTGAYFRASHGSLSNSSV